MGIMTSVVHIASRTFNLFRLLGSAGHRRRVRQARRVLRTLRSMEGDAVEARLFAYLRKVDPLVFEELVLCSFERAGTFVIRNLRYSGDRGIDGRVWIPRIGWCAVQAKRYGAHINHRHLEAFRSQLARNGYGRGLFVHTGRTGAAAYEHLPGQRVVLVSGQRLVNLLRGGYISDCIADVERTLEGIGCHDPSDVGELGRAPVHVRTADRPGHLDVIYRTRSR